MLHGLPCLAGRVPVCLCPEICSDGTIITTEISLPLLQVGIELTSWTPVLDACHQPLCAPQVTDEMLLAAAIALADYVSEERLEAGNIYPELADLREISPVVSSLFLPGPR